MEAEIIPMCEDQGMSIVPWAALGGGQLMSAEERKQKEGDPQARQARYPNPNDIKVCEALDRIAASKKTTLQAIVSPSRPYSLLFADEMQQALAYLFQQSAYVFPIVGVNTVDHVKAMPDALRIKLSKEEIFAIQTAAPFTPLFPVNFLFNFRNDQAYNTSLTAANNQQYQMAAWIDAPPKQSVSNLLRDILPSEPCLTRIYSRTNRILILRCSEI